MRAWRLVAGVLWLVATPVLAATRVTIQELKEYPEPHYGQTVLLECYYDKESPIWVRALPDADEWIGFFVTGKPEKALTWSGEYYNLLFAPYTMREAVRTLRGGDKITVIGEAFHYQSTSFDGAGIRVQQVLQGWGPTAKAIGQPAPSRLLSSASAVSSPIAQQPTPGDPPLSASIEKFAVTINGKRYEGLRIGDQYNFDGIEFQIDKAQ
ncbi:MAG: hypothetical protein HYY90_07045 [Candidatus Omnitrophica bacterium]|nr:hypothetical protein [Candidatus Omnitrophota bacterium]MBI3020933.1 hypothetical protein [Candidatus Omnitrophota bacterium]MBI3084105.1 hypothetical protein [Candidatus Omnitrophota bacterium]